MNKRYDYHSVQDFKIILIILTIGFAAVSICVSILIPDLAVKIFFSIAGVLLVTISPIAYLNGKNTFIEVSAEGILFHGWKKIIYSPWSGVREIKLLTPLKGTIRYKIFTDKGNFKLSMVEPANKALSLSDFIAKARGKYINELIDEIKKQAPHAKITYSPLNRPL